MLQKKEYEEPKLLVIVLSNLKEALVAACKNPQFSCSLPASRTVSGIN